MAINQRWSRLGSRLTVALVAVVLVALTGARSAAGTPTRPSKSPRCPSVLSRVTVPTLAPRPSGPTTTTTFPCRAVELGHAKWLGVFSWGIRQTLPSGTQIGEATLELELTERRGGKLTGKIAGTQTQVLALSRCPSSTVAPGRISADLAGTRTKTQIHLTATAVAYTPPTVTPCPGAGPPGTLGGVLVFPQSAAALAQLERSGKDEYRYEHQETVSAGGPPYTLEYSILLVKLKH